MKLTERKLAALRIMAKAEDGYTGMYGGMTGGDLARRFWPETWALGRKRSALCRGGGSMLSRMLWHRLVYVDRYRNGTPVYKISDEGRRALAEAEAGL